MSRPIIIDWFCGEGGAAMGYWQAGFEPIGFDIIPQPRYPFTFIHADCLDPNHRLWRLAAAAHASPMCQFGSEMRHSSKRRGPPHINLIPETRKAFKASGLPYVIENVRDVARAGHLGPDYVSLFGTMFDMHMVTSAGQRFDLSRERCFEANWTIVPPRDPGPQHPIANVFGGHLRARSGPYRTGGKTGRTVDFPGEDRPKLARELMQMPWATMGGMSEAVPPPFTAEIGRQLMERLEQRRIAA